MALYISGYDEEQNPIWADDGEAAGGGASYSNIDIGQSLAVPPSETSDISQGVSPQYLADRAIKTETIAGDIIYTQPDGTKYGVNPETGQYYSLTDAQYAAMTNADKTGVTPETFASLRGQPVAPTGQSVTDKIYSQLKGAFTDAKGNTNWAALATAAAGVKAITGADKVQTPGYKGSVPMDLQAVRGRINYEDPNRRPGSMGRQYFTDTAFANPANAPTAREAVTNQAKGILAGYAPTSAPAATTPTKAMETLPESSVSKVPMAVSQQAQTLAPAAPNWIAQETPIKGTPGYDAFIASGGIPMARGGVAQPRYLQGSTDGMADQIPSSIDGKQKAALSHGEFVIPADVVSHLGNGNSDAGAKKLYDMMARIRKARTGNSDQGKRINPDKFMPGGQVGYASGGIAKFVEGGTTGSVGTTGTSAASTAIPNLGTSTESSLSSWAGPYVSDYLSKGAALSNAPYQAYTGPLTAGASDLQTQQFGGLSNLANNSTFNANQAQSYMNPYISAALNPQLEELRRQSQISQLGNANKATQAGAFGGSRQALMDAETQRSLLSEQNKAIGSGYATAFDKATGQFNADQNRQLQIQQALGTAGATQRDIEQQGITADKTQFEEQRDFPYKMVQYQKDLLQGLPITTSSNTTNQTQLSQLAGQVQGLMGLYQSLANLGQTKTTA
jgi:hypothetical protein